MTKHQKRELRVSISQAAAVIAVPGLPTTTPVKRLVEGPIRKYDHSQFEFKECMDEGAFSTARKACWPLRQRMMVIKTPKKKMTQKEIEVFLNELVEHRKLYTHDRILSFYGVIIDPKTGMPGMVLQHANGGNLRDFLSKRFKTLTWEDKFYLGYEMAEGLDWLHYKGVVHKDLHSKNILIHNNRVLIADFAITKPITKSTMYGMPAYIEPQCYLQDDVSLIGRPSDVYSLGVLLWEVTSGKPPFANLSADDVIRDIHRHHRERPVDGTPVDYVELYKKCWQDDPALRPTAEQVLQQFHRMKKNFITTSQTSRKCLPDSPTSSTISSTPPASRSSSISSNSPFIRTPEVSPESHDEDEYLDLLVQQAVILYIAYKDTSKDEDWHDWLDWMDDNREHGGKLFYYLHLKYDGAHKELLIEQFRNWGFGCKKRC